MKLIIDDADIEAIRRMAAYYPVDGVTTNPTILSRTGRKPYEVLKEIRDFLGDEQELNVQVTAADAEGMLKDADRIRKELGPQTFVKVPVTREGLKAIRLLSERGVSVTATCIYTRMQAFLAGKAGAVYAAPYVNRIDNLGGDGLQTVRDIHDIYRKNDIPCRVLAASFKNSNQIQELVKYGIGAVTAPPAVIEGLIGNALVDMAVADFARDFEKIAGSGITMAEA